MQEPDNIQGTLSHYCSDINGIEYACFEQPLPEPDRDSGGQDGHGLHMRRLHGGVEPGVASPRKSEVVQVGPVKDISNSAPHESAILKQAHASIQHELMFNKTHCQPSPIRETQRPVGYVGYNDTTDYVALHGKPIATYRGTTKSDITGTTTEAPDVKLVHPEEVALVMTQHNMDIKPTKLAPVPLSSNTTNETQSVHTIAHVEVNRSHQTRETASTDGPLTTSVLPASSHEIQSGQGRVRTNVQPSHQVREITENYRPPMSSILHGGDANIASQMRSTQQTRETVDTYQPRTTSVLNSNANIPTSSLQCAKVELNRPIEKARSVRAPTVHSNTLAPSTFAPCIKLSTNTVHSTPAQALVELKPVAVHKDCTATTSNHVPLSLSDHMHTAIQSADAISYNSTEVAQAKRHPLPMDEAAVFNGELALHTVQPVARPLHQAKTSSIITEARVHTTADVAPHTGVVVAPTTLVQAPVSNGSHDSYRQVGPEVCDRLIMANLHIGHSSKVSSQTPTTLIHRRAQMPTELAATVESSALNSTRGGHATNRAQTGSVQMLQFAPTTTAHVAYSRPQRHESSKLNDTWLRCDTASNEQHLTSALGSNITYGTDSRYNHQAQEREQLHSTRDDNFVLQGSAAGGVRGSHPGDSNHQIVERGALSLRNASENVLHTGYHNATRGGHEPLVDSKHLQLHGAYDRERRLPSAGNASIMAVPFNKGEAGERWIAALDSGNAESRETTQNLVQTQVTSRAACVESAKHSTRMDLPLPLSNHDDVGDVASAEAFDRSMRHGARDPFTPRPHEL